MVKSRILWILWLLLLGICWFVSGKQAGLLLLLLSLLLPLLSALLFPGIPGKLEVRLHSEAAGRKTDKVRCSIFLKNNSFIPITRVICRVTVENLLTGEKRSIPVRMAVHAKGECVEYLQLKSAYAGRVRIRAVGIIVYDYFGLFRFTGPIRENAETRVLFRPETFGLTAELSYGENSSLDSDVYSMRKPGFDPSETFAIREYRAGDKIKQIHWKLSEKYDDLVVREYGLPIQNSVFLVLETGRLPGTKRPDPARIDALAEGLVSLSQELIEQQVVHCIGWQNHEENTFYCVDIESDEDLAGNLTGLMTAIPGEDALSVVDHYLEQHEQMAFAHVVLFSAERREELSWLAGQCILTEVICEEGGSGLSQENGVTVISASPEHMAEALVYVEI